LPSRHFLHNFKQLVNRARHVIRVHDGDIWPQVILGLADAATTQVTLDALDACECLMTGIPGLIPGLELSAIEAFDEGGVIALRWARREAQTPVGIAAACLLHSTLLTACQRLRHGKLRGSCPNLVAMLFAPRGLVIKVSLNNSTCDSVYGSSVPY